MTYSFRWALIALAAASAQTSDFSSSTRLVEVDVIARSKGAPAAGLTKDDFALFDNGKTQKISVFSVRSREARQAVEAGEPLRRGVVSNRMERGGESLVNATILFIDQKNTPQAVQGFAIQRVQRFLRAHRGEQRIGVYTLLKDGSVQVIQELTADPRLLDRAADSLHAKDPLIRIEDTAGMTQHAAESLGSIDLMDRGMATKHALQAIARHLASAPGRKSLIWVTTGFPLLAPNLGIDFRPDMDEVARQLNDANIALYAVDGRGLQGALSGITPISNAESGGPRTPGQLVMQARRGEGDPLELATMNMLAGLTGGLVSYNKSNAIESSIQTAVDDGALTYTLGFYPDQNPPDGKWHKLKVEVKSRGVSVRYRENYFASRTLDEAQDRPALDQLLKDHLNATQLEVAVEAAPDAARAGVLKVSVNVGLHDIALEHNDRGRTGALDVSFYVEGTGKVFTKTLRLDIPDDQFAAFLEKGIDTVESIDTAGRREALRVVVQDKETGAAGSVTLALDGR